MLTATLLFGAGLGAGATSAAPPPNDDFAAATDLTLPAGRLQAFNIDASPESGEPLHAENPPRRSVWWRVTPSVSGQVTVYTYGSSFDTLLAVYRGDALENLEEVVANDDGRFGTQSLVSFHAVAGEAHHVAVDGYRGQTGLILLTWHFREDGTASPPNDNFADRDELMESAGLLVASNEGATREPGEPAHGIVAGGASLWWSLRPVVDGMAVLTTEGSSFDTVLGVYTGSQVDDLSPVASDDDGGEGLSSFTSFAVSAGVDYHVAVAGAEDETGILVLAWRTHASCGDPAAAAEPSPGDHTETRGPTVELRWEPRRELVQNVIYGEDDRRDVYEIADPGLLDAWRSTAAMVDRFDLVENVDGTFSLNAPTLGQKKGLCPDEPFREQPVPALCSGFLAAPDLIVTAGHCVTSFSDCTSVAFVFGFQMLDANTPVMTFEASQVYFCSGVVDRRNENDTDWAIVQLDRPVTDRAPLPVRREGVLDDSASLVVMGHPSGLPAKIAGGARIRDNSHPVFFSANLDTYAGSSGSPVFDEATMVVEGILVRGEEDYVERGGCFVSNQCPDDDPQWLCRGEEATRTREFAHLVPPRTESTVYDIFLGSCGQLEFQGQTVDPRWTTGDLQPGVVYCWQVVTKDECGVTPGPVWSFTTSSDGTPPFRRGDANQDTLVDISDPIAMLGFMFLGDLLGAECESAMDIDDNGLVEITDAVNLLGHQFLGEPAPPPPFTDCGSDPTGDSLGCQVFTPCQSP